MLSRQPSPSPPIEEQPIPQEEQTQSGPQLPEDTALTAFAQLCALRLNTRRCLISFFDRRNCYILAEATRTICLHSGQPEFAADNLCFGTTAFPKEQSICNYTVNLAWKDYGIGVDAFENHPSLVVNDLTKDSRFRHYPFVTGAPHSRFYAGVPIRSPTGLSIGTLCVLDEKPRDGLAQHELIFLKTMSFAVMKHLEMSRTTEEQRRGKIMVKSLGSFAEGKTGLENWWAEPWDSATNEQSPRVGEKDLEMVVSPGTIRTTEPVAMPAHLEQRSSTGSSLPSAPSIIAQTPSAAITPATDIEPEIRPEVTTTVSSSTIGDGRNKIAPELKATFDRAASMIVDAIEADGAIFLDAKISSFGGLIDEDVLTDQLLEQEKLCAILGAALSKKKPVHAIHSSPGRSISESALRHMLRTYPHGQIFNLDDDLTSPGVNSPSGGAEFENSEGFPFTVARKSESNRSFDEETYLKSIAPRSKSLVMFPLWDSHRDRWFASAIVWSSDPMRVFTNEQELSYLAAFSNSVMAEVARLDTKLADAAKADFISSISHELRSPLHGILGMTDLLKDTDIDNQQVSHVATIETCGKTLLETINHVRGRAGYCHVMLN